MRTRNCSIPDLIITDCTFYKFSTLKIILAQTGLCMTLSEGKSNSWTNTTKSTSFLTPLGWYWYKAHNIRQPGHTCAHTFTDESFPLHAPPPEITFTDNSLTHRFPGPLGIRKLILSNSLLWPSCLFEMSRVWHRTHLCHFCVKNEKAFVAATGSTASAA